MPMRWDRTGDGFGIGGDGNGRIRIGIQESTETLERILLTLHVFEQYAVQQAPVPPPVQQSCTYGIVGLPQDVTPSTQFTPLTEYEADWVMIGMAPPRVDIVQFEADGSAFVANAMWHTGSVPMESKSRRRPLAGEQIHYWLMFTTSDANGFDANFTFGSWYAQFLFSS